MGLTEIKDTLKLLLLKTLFIVFTVSFCTITLELILSRISVFYLDYSNSFLAIPITLFGLAVGSLCIHLSKKNISSFNIPRNLLYFTIFSFVSFVVVFLLFSSFFPITRDEVNWMVVSKAGIFSGIFIIPFYFAGRILTVLFAKNKNMIGQLYAVDLLGAAIACFVAPIMFHYFDLPYLIFFCLLAMSITTTYIGKKQLSKYIWFVLIINISVLQILIFLEKNYNLNSKTILRLEGNAEQIAHRWNEFSRVSLLKITPKIDGNTKYRIIHDNAESNVDVSPYRPSRKRSYKFRSDDKIAIPFFLKRKIDNVLVMFAGCGKQMLQFHDYSGGNANIVGVELNPLVKKFAVETAELEHYHLKVFFDLPNINLVIAEGRSFLEKDDKKYDVIYAGSDAATAQYKIGHSRKYLDTTEAMKSYIDHLEKDGLLIFHAQPSIHKLQSIKKIFDERNIKNFEKCVIVLSELWDWVDYVVISLKPFTSAELETIKKQFKDKIYYVPDYSKNEPLCEKIINDNLSQGTHFVTDDRPYIRMIDFSHYELFPLLSKIKNRLYYVSWIKITTLLVVSIVLLVVLSSLYISKSNMPPLYIVGYLLITGFCYMLCEITYIGKLELFIGNPLYSMALLLSIFLVGNSIGSILFDKLLSGINISLLLFIPAISILATLWLMNKSVSSLIGLPLFLKILITIFIVSPSALCLGLFYPYAVTWLSRKNMAYAIPITYGLSTLASVAGATYAMIMVVNFGYTQIILQAAAGYIVLSVISLPYSRLFR